jgi:preprotein translocase subunit SecD
MHALESDRNKSSTAAHDVPAPSPIAAYAAIREREAVVLRKMHALEGDRNRAAKSSPAAAGVGFVSSVSADSGAAVILGATEARENLNWITPAHAARTSAIVWGSSVSGSREQQREVLRSII